MPPKTRAEESFIDQNFIGKQIAFLDYKGNKLHKQDSVELVAIDLKYGFYIVKGTKNNFAIKMDLVYSFGEVEKTEEVKLES